MTAQRTFNIEISASGNFKLEELWLLGDAPKDPSVEEVREMLLELGGSKGALASELGLELELRIKLVKL